VAQDVVAVAYWLRQPGPNASDVARRLKEKHERIDYEQGRLKLADMLGGDLDLSGLPLDRPLPDTLLPEVTSINRRRGRVEIFRRYARQGLTLRELIIQAQETGHWSVAGTPEQLADAIEERVKSGVLDVLSLHGGPPGERSAARAPAPSTDRYRLYRRGFSLQSGAAAACVTDSHPDTPNGLTASRSQLRTQDRSHTSPKALTTCRAFSAVHTDRVPAIRGEAQHRVRAEAEKIAVT
jgi:hypothetical protein